MARTALMPAAALLLGLACHGSGARHPQPAPDQRGARLQPEAGGDAEGPRPPAAPATPARAPAPYKPPSSLGAPAQIRQAQANLRVHDAPSREGDPRGRILRGESFHVYSTQEGPGCKRPWAEVAEAGWVCLERTELSEQAPAPLPPLETGALVPFIYARHKHHDDPHTPAIPVYDSVSAYRAGADPIETLPAYGSWAFTRARGSRAEPLYVTPGRDVVPGKELELFEPSEFEGRDLAAEPVPAGATLAWAVRWKTSIRAAPDPDAPQIGRVKYHATALVVGEGVLDSEGQRWFEVRGEGERSAGYLAADDIRRFIPVAPDAPILGGQVTLDVDLDEQVLSVWIEDRPVFATLISSGKVNDRTPPGVYRVESKRAYGKMQSQKQARDPYYVDAVPWTIYFKGRYALHTAYWHDMFGHRMSHGCVNLAPKDAKRVFELAGPRLPEGWLVVHEHARDPGALVRIRRAGHELPDRREPLAGSDTSTPG